MTHAQLDFVNCQINDIKRIMHVDNVQLTLNSDDDELEDYVYTFSFVYDKHFHIDIKHVEPAAIYVLSITIPCLAEYKVFDLPLTHDGGILSVLMLIKQIVELSEF